MVGVTKASAAANALNSFIIMSMHAPVLLAACSGPTYLAADSTGGCVREAADGNGRLHAVIHLVEACAARGEGWARGAIAVSVATRGAGLELRTEAAINVSSDLGQPTSARAAFNGDA